MPKRPTTAVIAAAGFGTRFLPQTKAMPKEMLPIVDKPIIQYVVEELVSAGIKDIIIVTGYSKRSIEDHFDTPNAELSALLEKSGKTEVLAQLHDIADMANFAFVRQKRGQIGNVFPLLTARHLLRDEPFIYTWADEFVKASPSLLAQTLEAYEQTGGSILSCIELTDDASYDRYGIVGGTEEAHGLIRLSTIKEKPGKANAPSNLASVGGFLLTPEIFPYLDRVIEEHTDEQSEVKVQTAIQHMLDDGLSFYAYKIKDGRYYDAGDKLDYIKTIVAIGLEREDIGPELREYLKRLAL